MISLFYVSLVIFKTDQLDEDSSYDSDTEINSPRQNVSRNVSETLAQELDDFNSVRIFFVSLRHHQHPDVRQNNGFFLFQYLNRQTTSIWSLH